jgi:thiaminase
MWCYWIYWEVGESPPRNGFPNPPYKKRIDTYGGEEFGVLIQAVLELSDRVCEELNLAPETSRHGSLRRH